MFDKGLIFGRDRSHLSMVASGAADIVSRTNAELVEIAIRDVAAALPRTAGATLTHAIAVRERHATFSLAPGQPRRPPCETPVNGLLLAGDWIDTGLGATIESAVVSGHWGGRAAPTPGH